MISAIKVGNYISGLSPKYCTDNKQIDANQNKKGKLSESPVKELMASMSRCKTGCFLLPAGQ